MAISIQSQRGLPLYFQIIEQIKHRIATADLKSGEQLPTVRKLAVELSVNPNTVAKAYAELERQGIIRTRQGIGTFVQESENVLDPDDRRRKLDALCDQFITEAKRFGFTIQQLIENLDARIIIQERRK